MARISHRLLVSLSTLLLPRFAESVKLINKKLFSKELEVIVRSWDQLQERLVKVSEEELENRQFKQTSCAKRLKQNCSKQFCT
ncbi:hypothetical protein SO802_029975 [Lithocarpus litseifolius]|uniref:Uncharacterized protein n=1 Tax=Lithocarpus litseifolius TaxID=425828 RepID=A0AAW2BV76_9ROSI